MKKTAIVIFSFLTGVFSVSAQDISSVFVSVPNDIVFGLEDAQKSLLVSDMADTAQIKVESNLYSHIKRLAISPDFISLQTSEVGTTQIRLLPLINDSKIVCVVKTVCGEVCDSQIKFYTTKWVPLPKRDLFPVRDINWFIKADTDRDSQDFKNAFAALDIHPMKVTLFADNDDISIEYDIKKYLSAEDYRKIEPFLTQEPKVFAWDRNSFK